MFKCNAFLWREILFPKIYKVLLLRKRWKKKKQAKFFRVLYVLKQLQKNNPLVFESFSSWKIDCLNSAKTLRGSFLKFTKINKNFFLADSTLDWQEHAVETDLDMNSKKDLRLVAFLSLLLKLWFYSLTQINWFYSITQILFVNMTA